MSQSDAIETLGLAAAAEGAGGRTGTTEAWTGLSCLNCGTPLAGTFCSRCGQSVHDHSRSILHAVTHALGDFWHFDSRVLRTLAALLFRPGRMTLDYRLGRRTRYVPPLRLYLFSSLVFFLLLSLANMAIFVVELRPSETAPAQAATAATTSGQPPAGETPAADSATGEKLADAARKTREAVDRLPPGPARGVAERLADSLVEAEAGADNASKSTDSFLSVGGRRLDLPEGTTLRVRFFIDLDDWTPSLRISEDALRSFAEDASDTGDAPTPTVTLRTEATESGARATTEITTDEAVWKDWESRMIRGIAMSLDHPESLNGRMGDNLAKVMFILMPIYAVILAVLYWRRRWYFMDHLAFALHVHAFVFVMLIGVVLLRMAFPQSLPVLESFQGAAWMMGILALYTWVALKLAYGQGVIRTTIKWVLLAGTYSFLIFISMFFTLIFTLPQM